MSKNDDPSAALYPPVDSIPAARQVDALAPSINVPSDIEAHKDEVPVEQLSFCHPRRNYRWVVLIFICLLTFGSYFSYDNPTALETQLQMPPPYGFNMTGFQYNMLYSMYSWPNTVLAFLGGVVVDKWLGIRLGGFVFALFICLGQVIVSIGAQIGNIVTMYVGRFVFGLGGENLAVVQNAYTVRYFAGKEMNLVFGLALSISRVGSVVNMNIEGPIAWLYGLAVAFWIGSILCLMSTGMSLVLWFLDRRAERMLPPVKPKPAEKIDFTYILRFPLSFWLICLICVFVYIGIFPFIGNASTFIAWKWPALKEHANTINSLPYLISGFASPVFGFIVDRVGFNPLWVTGATTSVLACHLVLGFTYLTPWVPFVVFGVAYSMTACALWPMVGYVIPPEQLGTAYGIMQAAQNLGLAVAPLLIGKLQDMDPTTFSYPGYFFMASVGFSVMLSVFLSVQDRSRSKPTLMLGRVALAKLREENQEEQDRVEEERVAILSRQDADDAKPSYGAA